MNNLFLKLKILGVLIFFTIGMTSCLKEFDPDSYAPKKSFGGFESSADIESDALVAYWAFDDNLVDSAGGLQADNNGTTFDASGVKGAALKIDTGQYILFNDPGTDIPNLEAYTISFWVKAPQNTSYGYGVFSLANNSDFWGNLDLYLDNGSTSDTAVFSVHMNNGNAQTKSQFMSKPLGSFWDQWVQLVVTYNSSASASKNFKIYKNGTEVFSSLISGYGALKFENATAMVIGTWQFQTDPSLTSGTGAQSWAGSLIGMLDEFRIYDTPLNAAEVNALYKLEKAGR